MLHSWRIRFRLAALLADAGLFSLTLGFRGELKLALSAWSDRTLRKLGVEVSVMGACPPAGLWVANHLSWLDPLVLLALRPSGVLAKEEVAHYPLLGWGARRAGLTFVRREDPSSRAAACLALADELEAGGDFLLFPEGTTTCGRTLAPFYEGGIRLAYRLGVPVLPLRLDSPDPHYPWTADQALLPHAAELIRLGGARLEVRPGERLLPRDFIHEDSWVQAIHSMLRRDPRCARRSA